MNSGRTDVNCPSIYPRGMRGSKPARQNLKQTEKRSDCAPPEALASGGAPPAAARGAARIPAIHALSRPISAKAAISMLSVRISRSEMSRPISSSLNRGARPTAGDPPPATWPRPTAGDPPPATGEPPGCIRAVRNASQAASFCRHCRRSASQDVCVFASCCRESETCRCASDSWPRASDSWPRASDSWRCASASWRPNPFASSPGKGGPDGRSDATSSCGSSFRMLASGLSGSLRSSSVCL